MVSAVLAGLLATTAQASPVNLSTWVAEGSGTWNVAADQNSVLQTVNTANGTVFYGPDDAQGTALSGEITVGSTSDDDFIGFVLGYQGGDLTAPTTDYLVIDWKRGTQPFYSACDNSIDGIRGLAISRVSGPMEVQDAWCHNGNWTELQRAATLGDTGWVRNQTYEFDLEFTSTNVRVLVDGVEEISIDGTFADGAFGFYNFSQDNVSYAGLTETVLPPVDPPVSPIPLPASIPLLLAGLGALGFAGRRTS